MYLIWCERPHIAFTGNLEPVSQRKHYTALHCILGNTLEMHFQNSWKYLPSNILGLSPTISLSFTKFFCQNTLKCFINGAKIVVKSWFIKKYEVWWQLSHYIYFTQENLNFKFYFLSASEVFTQRHLPHASLYFSFLKSLF